MIGREFFARSVHEVAPDLIGGTLLVGGVGGVIVEVEAYDQEDPASHGYAGRTPRTASMFGPPGHASIYFNDPFGNHLEITCMGYTGAVEQRPPIGTNMAWASARP